MKINREAKLAELERIFESCGSPFSQEEEARRWLQNYKNSKPLFKLYDFEKLQFSKRLQPFEKELLTFSDDERANPPSIGSIITYKFTGTTSSGLPRFATYLRIRSK